MRNTVISQTGPGTTAWVPVDTFKNPFSLSVACVVDGTVNYDVEHTYDDVLEPVAATAWANADLTGDTANGSSVYSAPVKAIRLRVNSGSGTVTMTIVQAG